MALRLRNNVDNLDPAQLLSLRHAFRAVQRIQDERGYNYHAGKHGLPLPRLCQHGTIDPSQSPLFLPWHRAYLYLFELALQDALRDALQRGEVPSNVSPEVALPWWDWTSSPSHPSGIPEAFVTEQVDGQPNPLYSVVLPPAAQPQAIPDALSSVPLPYGVPAGWNNETFRHPGRPDRLPRKSEVDSLQALKTYTDFHTQLEMGAHNHVHVWVGGTMYFIEWSAYDPLFWAHHANVDRLWYLWQISENGVDPDRNALDRALPLGNQAMRVREALDINKLGYEYASVSAAVPGTGGGR